jgi:hypothetical protein
MTSTHASKVSQAEKRRSTRVALSIAIVVAGIDALGEPFREATTTTEVNCYGCRYRSKNYLQKGSSVAIEVPHSELKSPPRLVRGRVIWVQRPRRLREAYEVAVELEVAGNIWGVASPPKDWFPHPDEPAPVVAERADPAAKHPALETVGAAELDVPAPLTLIPEASPAERPASLVAVEEMTFTLSHLAGPAERSPADALDALVAQLVGQALDEIAQQTRNRILDILSEAQQASRVTAEELEARIREALDATAGLQSPLASDALKPRRRKRPRRTKLAADGSPGKH